jgi:hypothetical protein
VDDDQTVTVAMFTWVRDEQNYRDSLTIMLHNICDSLESVLVLAQSLRVKGKSKCKCGLIYDEY